MNFIIRWVVTAVAVGAAVWIVPGINAVGEDGTVSIAVMALVLALVNMSVKPIAQILSLPVTVITLGIFYLVVNALMLELAAWLSTGLFSSGVAIDSFGSAFLGAIIISIVSSLANNLIGNNQ